MKKVNYMLILAAICMSSVMTGQEVEPKFEKEGELVKAIFYYEDGAIRQEGTYKNGKLHGEWISYDQNGKKSALAQYREGKKEGQWFFWADDVLMEVDYDNNRIASVQKYQSTNPVVSRD